jgi:hypothetical protein
MSICYKKKRTCQSSSFVQERCAYCSCCLPLVGNGKSLSLGLQERIPLPIKANQNAQLGINHALHCLLHLCNSWYIYTSTPRSQMHCRRLYGLSLSLSLLSTLFASQYKDTDDNSFSMDVTSDVHRLFPDCGFSRPNIFLFCYSC